MIKNKIFSIWLLLLLPIAACSKKAIESDEVTPAKELYETATSFLMQHKYKKAADEYEKIFFQHPGKPITAHAELMQAYCLFLEENYEQAIDILHIFINLHPRHTDIAYAYYLTALCHYNQISDVDLDQSHAYNAMQVFEEIISRFPGTEYAKDVAAKLHLAKDQLAGKEMLVGRYYLSVNNPIAAVKRFSVVLNEYKNTNHVPEALCRLIESNLMMGLNKYAEQYNQVLLHNFPNNKWSIKSQKLIEARHLKTE